MYRDYFNRSVIGTAAEIVPARIESATPSAYRLCIKKSGEKVLQGKFDWECGYEHGYEWRDIPEVKED